ncbi:MAG: hypothetical protein J6386_01990 [Candidatus Synoicihabitans palmerolidicus]|nr:hypothetical protein [Candidatus Synoicihabitans palmerolidicus]
MKLETPIDTIISEMAHDICGCGPAVFVTAITWHPDLGLFRRESHVFISRGEVHLHKTIYRNHHEPLSDPTFKTEIEATHQLLANFRASRFSARPDQVRNFGPSATSELTYHVTPTSEPPDAALLSQGLFRSTLDLILDATTSNLLRQTLRGAMYPSINDSKAVAYLPL